MQKKKINVYDVASQFLISDPKIEKIDPKNDPNNLTFDTFYYTEQNGLKKIMKPKN